MSERRDQLLTSPSPVLEVSGLRIELASGVDVVSEISFELETGKVLGLVGESGCGKTSVAHAMLGEARAGARISAGQVLLQGRDLLTLDRAELRRARGTAVAYVPQNPTASLNPRHRVGAQVAEALTVHGHDKRSAREEAAAQIAAVGLPADEQFLRRYPFELSGGQQQRIAIAMALVCKPAVVVLDEPTTGLDVTTQARLLALVRALASTHSTSFVYVSHDLAVVEGLVDQIAVMYAGRVVEAGGREAIFARPAHPYTGLLLQSVPHLHRRDRLTGIPGAAPAPGHRPEGCSFSPRCPLASERCRAEPPPSTRLEDGRAVRCWHPYDLPLGTREEYAVTTIAAGSETPLLAVEDIEASYGGRADRTPVLHGISVDLRRGECVAIVGESGSGKTTLGRCIAGLHRPDAGRILLDGEVLAATAPKRTAEQRERLQIIFQNPDRSLNPRRTVGEIVGRPLVLFDHASRQEVRLHAAELLARVSLPAHYLDRHPAELSGGEKQRVAIARALAARPALIVCDEITSALDVSVQAAIVALLQGLRDDGLALFFITHDLGLVNATADRVLVIRDGETREIGTTREVIDQPRDSYTRELLSAATDGAGKDDNARVA